MSLRPGSKNMRRNAEMPNAGSGPTILSSFVALLISLLVRIDKSLFRIPGDGRLIILKKDIALMKWMKALG